MLVILAVCIMEMLAGNFRDKSRLAVWLSFPGIFDEVLKPRRIDLSFEDGVQVIGFEDVGMNRDGFNAKTG